MRRTKFITEAAVIAAIYALLTIAVNLIPALSTFNYGPIQFRISEALTILPFITASAIPGLAVGCLVANIFSPYPIDMVVGTLATLIAAIGTFYIGKLKYKHAEYLAPLPPVFFNALIIGWQITYFTHTPIIFNFLTVGAGQLVVCYVLGLPLLKTMKRFYKG